MNQHTILRLRRLQVAYEKNGQKKPGVEKH